MKLLSITISIIIIIMTFNSLSLSDETSDKLYELTHSILAGYGTDPLIVNAVKFENSKGKTLRQIQLRDKEWNRNTDLSDYMSNAMLESECGQYLQKIQKNTNNCSEIILMDNQGASVALSHKSSGYWHGDEVTFINAFNDGKGDVYIDERMADSKAAPGIVHVSVPVIDADKAIGTITFCIDKNTLK